MVDPTGVITMYAIQKSFNGTGWPQYASSENSRKPIEQQIEPQVRLDDEMVDDVDAHVRPLCEAYGKANRSWSQQRSAFRNKIIKLARNVLTPSALCAHQRQRVNHSRCVAVFEMTPRKTLDLWGRQKAERVISKKTLRVYGGAVQNIGLLLKTLAVPTATPQH